MRVLITGADGFIGSHFVEHLLVNTDWRLVLLCNWGNGGLAERLTQNKAAQHPDRVEVHTHDLQAPVSPLLRRSLGEIGAIVHFAAESHVDTSISYPRQVIENNVACTLTVLDLARHLDPKPKVVVQVSTDEVYGPAEKGVRHVEWENPLIPSNPYSASKAAQEMVNIAYWRTYAVPSVIVNAMNNVGERQHPEKFLPMLVRSILGGETVGLHAADGVPGSRVYLHARNFADAILWVLQRPPAIYAEGASRPDRWHVEGQECIDNLELAHRVAELLGLPLRYKLVDGNKGRPGHDLHYDLDGGKLRAAGWSPPLPFQDALVKTVAWYVANDQWLEL